jgi:hypothetical protein
VPWIDVLAIYSHTYIQRLSRHTDGLTDSNQGAGFDRYRLQPAVGHEQIVTCIDCFDHYESSSSHVSDERRNTTSRRSHDGPRLSAVLDASIATAPFARRCTKLIDYHKIDRQAQRWTQWWAQTCALRQTAGCLTQSKHNAQQ